jgi:hypothetical protein
VGPPYIHLHTEYPGADWVSDNIDLAPSGSLGNPLQLANAITMFRESAGDLAAFDYRFYVRNLNLSIGDAAKEIIDSSPGGDANLQRVEAMRQYAATVA